MSPGVFVVSAVVLTVICEDEANIMDQRKVDIQLWKK